MGTTKGVVSPSAERDPYAYVGTDVLRNHRHTAVPEKLHKYESEVALVTLARLNNNPIQGRFDAIHYTDIHAHGFQEIYPFAGEYRKNTVAKQDPLSGAIVHFPPPDEAIPLLSDALKYQLPDHAALRGISNKELSVKLADVTVSTHYAHIFRDGNSRTTREFARTLAASLGYELDWERIKRQELLPALFARTFDEKNRVLPSLLERAIVNKRPDPEIQRRYDHARPASPPWRGTISEAIDRSAAKSRTQPVFVDGSWEEASRVRLWSREEVQAIVASTRAATGATGRADARDFGVRQFGGVYHLATNKDLFIRLDEKRSDYPERLQHAADRHFGKSRTPEQRGRNRGGPDFDIE